MKIVCVGDAMIPGEDILSAAKQLGTADYQVADWERDWKKLQNRRLIVEQQGPGAESIPEIFCEHTNTEIALGLFCPFSADMMDRVPNLRLIGVARAGVENVDVAAATLRGILVLHVMGRNAEAVSDFTVGMLLSEVRNIARAHTAIHNREWRKEFSNSEYVPELKGKTVGIVGFGYIGRLVAQKLSGFGVTILAYDPWVNQAGVECNGVHFVDKETLFETADFITLHARLNEGSKYLVGANEFDRMKQTAYLVNTARSGLVDTAALVTALRDRRFAGAALDVFDVEPIPENHPLLSLDNVTLTTHIAGTTREALTRSPELLVNEIEQLLDGQECGALQNPEVLNDPSVREWLRSAAKQLGRKS